MLPVLVGSTNLTNWKKPNTQQGNFSITLQESKHTQHTKRGRTNTARPFFLRIVRKGKRNNDKDHKATRTNKASKEDKERQPEQRRTTSIKGEQTQGQKKKNKGKYAASHITA